MRRFDMTLKQVFKPRRSTGWVWVTVIGLVLLAVGLGLFFSTGTSGPFLITILLTCIIGLGFLAIAIFFPSMRYEIGDTCLTLTYGPMLRYSINFKEIKSIHRRDLGFGAVSSFRFPGLALFKVPYPEVGTVNMCATASGNGILLIETSSTKYGITPTDEEEFVAELRKHIVK
jgi:hypothetical protein